MDEEDEDFFAPPYDEDLLDPVFDPSGFPDPFNEMGFPAEDDTDDEEDDTDDDEGELQLLLELFEQDLDQPFAQQLPLSPQTPPQSTAQLVAQSIPIPDSPQTPTQFIPAVPPSPPTSPQTPQPQQGSGKTQSKVAPEPFPYKQIGEERAKRDYLQTVFGIKLPIFESMEEQQMILNDIVPVNTQIKLYLLSRAVRRENPDIRDQNKLYQLALDKYNKELSGSGMGMPMRTNILGMSRPCCWDR